MMRVLGSGIVTLAALLVLSGEGVANDPPLIAQVRAAWKEREAKVRTAKFEWTQTVFTVKGGHSDGTPEAPLPPEDYSYVSPCQLYISEDQVAFNLLRRFWHPGKAQYCDIPTEYVFAGRRQLSLNHPGFSEEASALISSATVTRFPTYVRPVLRTVRGTTASLGADDLDEFTVTGASTLIDGRRGYELVSKGGPGRAEVHLWVDPSREFVTLRHTVGVPNRPPRRQVDIKYQPNGPIGWVPSSWREVEASMVDGRVISTVTATMKNVRLNEDLPPETFNITLPVGTRVTDETGTRPTEYIWKGDGTKRIVRPGEERKTVEELLRTPDPVARPKWWYIGLMAGVFVVGVVLFWLRIRMLRRREPGSQPGTIQG